MLKTLVLGERESFTGFDEVTQHKESEFTPTLDKRYVNEIKFGEGVQRKEVRSFLGR